MCVTFVLYYPAIQLAQCVSSPIPAPVLAALGITEVRTDGSVLITQYTLDNAVMHEGRWLVVNLTYRPPLV